MEAVVVAAAEEEEQVRTLPAVVAAAFAHQNLSHPSNVERQNQRSV